MAAASGRCGAAAAVAVDLFLLAVALPFIIVQVLFRTSRSWLSSVLHRLAYGGAGAARRDRRARSVAALEHGVPPAHASLASSACAIAAALRAGDYTAVDCVRAYITQARKAHGCLNAIKDERFDAALAEAAATDERLREWRASGRSQDVLPPLLGVPCTIKEVFAHAGLRQTGGTLWRRERRAAVEDEAPPVQRLRRAGAIVICCTTSPELGMWYETSFIERVGMEARTSNPYSHYYSVGGSSGGEAALVAAAGAPFGLGSDIGGSIRMPAAFVGIFGHKPTGGLVSNAGQFPTTSNTCMATGPLCRYADDLLPLLTLLRGAEPRDPCSAEMWLVDVSLPLRSAIVESLSASVHAPVPTLAAGGAGGYAPLESPIDAASGLATLQPSPTLLVVDRTVESASNGDRSSQASPLRLGPRPAVASGGLPLTGQLSSSSAMLAAAASASASAFSAAGRSSASPVVGASSAWRSPHAPAVGGELPPPPPPHSPLARLNVATAAAYELPVPAAAEQLLRLRRSSGGGGGNDGGSGAPSPVRAAGSAVTAPSTPQSVGGSRLSRVPLSGGSTSDALRALLPALEGDEAHYHAPAAAAVAAAGGARNGGGGGGGGGGLDASLMWPRPLPITRWQDVTVFIIDDLDGAAKPFLSSPVAPSITAAIETAARTLIDVYGARGVQRLALPELRNGFELWSASLAAAQQPSFRSMMQEGYAGNLRVGAELFRWCLGASRSTLPALVLAAIEDIPARLAPARMRGLMQEAISLRERISATLAAVNGVVLCPVHPTTAPLHDVSLLRGPFNIAYTTIWNVCRVPVTVVPMGLDADGLPVAIQVVGAERFDRLTIAVAQALEHAGVAGWLPPAASSTCPKCRIDSGEAAAAEAAARGEGAGIR